MTPIRKLSFPGFKEAASGSAFSHTFPKASVTVIELR